MNGPSNIEEMSDENKRHHFKKAVNVQRNEDGWERAYNRDKNLFIRTNSAKKSHRGNLKQGLLKVPHVTKELCAGKK